MNVTKAFQETELLNSDWGLRILNAERNKGFTATDRKDALGWDTCACGKLDETLVIYETDCEGKTEKFPKDEYLFRWALDFFAAITSNRYVPAAHILVNIAERETELLIEQEAR